MERTTADKLQFIKLSIMTKMDENSLLKNQIEDMSEQHKQDQL